jgi:hypothetical protein
MSRPAKTLEKVLRGTSDANIGFADLCGLLRHLGFDVRVKGSHHIFTREGVVEILNLQPKRGGKAKPYQVEQVRDVISAYGLAGDADDPPDSDDEPSEEYTE